MNTMSPDQIRTEIARLEQRKTDVTLKIMRKNRSTVEEARLLAGAAQARMAPADFLAAEVARERAAINTRLKLLRLALGEH